VNTWNPEQYLKFASERTRPCHDLAGQVFVSNPRCVIDLGCGPGNSTEVLAARWPEAEIVGLDSSAQMIAAARSSQPARTWIQQDIAEWAATSGGKFDVVFSNAAIQWLSDHGTLLPRLLERVESGGALAIQVPAGLNAAQYRLMREIAQSPAWRSNFPAEGVQESHAEEMSVYYDVLAPRARAIDFWMTTYLHILSNAEAIVEWYKSTALRPFLDALRNPADRERFTAEYLGEIRKAFPPQPDGRVLLPFPRIFLIAYR
jgi:trans-aconitate 2-methyltransferase